jgi:hypothetical protein
MDEYYTVKLVLPNGTNYLLGITDNKDKFIEQWFNERPQFYQIEQESDSKWIATCEHYDNKIAKVLTKLVSNMNNVELLIPLVGDDRHHF